MPNVLQITSSPIPENLFMSDFSVISRSSITDDPAVALPLYQLMTYDGGEYHPFDAAAPTSIDGILAQPYDPATDGGVIHIWVSGHFNLDLTLPLLSEGTFFSHSLGNTLFASSPVVV